MVSTSKVFTNDSTTTTMTSTPVKKTSARKSLCLFPNILDVKNKTSACRFVSSKSDFKAIKYGSTPWELKQKLKVNSKINEQINKSLYNWIIHDPLVVKSPIVNDCLKLKIDGHTEPQLVLK